MKPQRFDLGVFHQTILQNLFRAQRVTAMDKRYLGGKVSQEQRLFHGGVAAADDNDFLTAIKETVAGRAGGHAKALECVLGRQAQPFCPRTRRQNNGIGGICCAAIARGGKGAF